MAEFYPDGESQLRSEKLDLKWSESLIADTRRCVCGNCCMAVQKAESLTTCPLSDCGVAWKQVIYVESLTTFRHQRLAMFGKAVFDTAHRPPSRDHPRSLPFIRQRMVEDNIVNPELL